MPRRALSSGGDTLTSNQRKEVMDEKKIDEAKGRIKEAAGDLADDEGLKKEGKVDRAAGSVKKTIDDAADKVKEAVNPDDNKSERDHERSK
jgi:uncharacterized protein YjbJ (UPF0337 family)